jgi:hypothetical protein
MMVSRGDSTLHAAEQLRQRLADEGRHRDAEILRGIVASYRASRQANRLLHADNQALKQGMPDGGPIDMDYPARARAKIAEIHAQLPADASFSMRRSALRRGYPFGERRYWPYQAWLQERAKYLRKYDPATPLGALFQQDPPGLFAPPQPGVPAAVAPASPPSGTAAAFSGE